MMTPSLISIVPEDGRHYFFGYYDLQPFDSKQKRHLAHRARGSAVPRRARVARPVRRRAARRAARLRRAGGHPAAARRRAGTGPRAGGAGPAGRSHPHRGRHQRRRLRGGARGAGPARRQLPPRGAAARRTAGFRAAGRHPGALLPGQPGQRAALAGTVPRPGPAPAGLLPPREVPLPTGLSLPSAWHPAGS